MEIKINKFNCKILLDLIIQNSYWMYPFLFSLKGNCNLKRVTIETNYFKNVLPL